MNYVWKVGWVRSFIHCSEEYRHQMYLARITSGLWDFIMLCPLYLLQFSLLFSFTILLYFIISFYSCYSHVNVFGVACTHSLVHEFAVPCIQGVSG